MPPHGQMPDVKRSEKEAGDRAKPGHHHQHHKQPQQQHAQQQHAAAGDNRLRRDTPFLATLRFKNDLPEVPGDPKLLVSQAEPSRLSAFTLTCLEKEPKRDLVLPSDLGIPISLLNVERYLVPKGEPQQLLPEDQVLLGSADDKSSMFGPSIGPSVHALRNTHVSWLMRTTYIAQDSDSVRKPGYNEKKAKSLRQASAGGDLDEVENRDKAIAAIEAAFEAAQRKPVHHKNPALVPVEVLPVMPDMQLWCNKFVQAHFDNDPTEEVEALSRLPSKIRSKVASRSMLKGFKVDNSTAERGHDHQDRFMALVVPEQIPESLMAEAEDGATADDEAEVDPSELTGDFTWSKEYQYEIIRKGEHQQEPEEGNRKAPGYFIQFKDGVAAYCDINTRLNLKRKEAKADAVQPARPAKVIIRTREPTEGEQAEWSRKMRRLHGQIGDDDEE